MSPLERRTAPPVQTARQEPRSKAELSLCGRFVLGRPSLIGPLHRGLPRRAKLNPERAPLARSGLDSHLSAHPLHSLLDERKSYTRPRVLLLAVQALEDLEDATVLGGIDTDAVVLDP